MAVRVACHCVRVLVAVLMAASGALAQSAPDPFLFTFTTPRGGDRVSPRWTVEPATFYDARAAEPLGLEGIGPRVAVRGALPGGVTVLGEAGVGPSPWVPTGTRDAFDTELALRGSVPRFEALKAVGATRAGRLAVGLGVRREETGATVLLGRLSARLDFARSSLVSNVRFEHAQARSRDRVDVITTVGWLRRIAPGVNVGAEAIGEDLEGFWDPNEAEGGAKLFAGPSLHLARPGARWWASACAGPIVMATRSGRSSLAGGRLGDLGNRYAARLSLGYSF